MGEIRPKKCEGRELTKDQLAERQARQLVPRCIDHGWMEPLPSDARVALGEPEQKLLRSSMVASKF